MYKIHILLIVILFNIFREILNSTFLFLKNRIHIIVK